MDYQNRLNKFKQLYENGNDREFICRSLNISRRTLLNYEKKLNVKVKNKYRTPNVDIDFFKRIDNEYKAYILGFIFADGYIESSERCLTFNINNKDLDILLKIKTIMKCDNDIKKSSTKNCVRLYISSKELVDDLKKLGVTRCKSKVIDMPKLRSDLYRHFLRGYFDGDGHIGHRQCALVVGSEKFFISLNEYLNEKFNTKIYYKKTGNYYRVQFSRKDCKIIKWMYEDSNISLDRKYKSYSDNWRNYTERIRTRG